MLRICRSLRFFSYENRKKCRLQKCFKIPFYQDDVFQTIEKLDLKVNLVKTRVQCILSKENVCPTLSKKQSKFPRYNTKCNEILHEIFLQCLVFPARYRVISRKIDYLWDSTYTVQCTLYSSVVSTVIKAGLGTPFFSVRYITF